ncbi:hypothetical protein FQZ97_1112120 [compost metagenome]
MNQQPQVTEITTGNSATMDWLMQLIDIDGPEIIGSSFPPSISQMHRASRPVTHD